MSDEDAEGLIDTRPSDPLATFNTRRRRGVRVTSAAAVALVDGAPNHWRERWLARLAGPATGNTASHASD